jgi:hypothetical protein
MSKIIELDVSDWLAGVYLVAVFYENKLVEIKEIVVAR